MSNFSRLRLHGFKSFVEKSDLDISPGLTGIVGPNGCGKTTLLNILLGEHEIMGGSLKTGASLDIGYYDQHQVLLDDSLTVMETIWQLVPQAPQGYVRKDTAAGNIGTACRLRLS